MTASPEKDLERYRASWTAPFESHIEARLRAGMTILDIGGGRRPSVPMEKRPAGVTYVGMDPVGDEMGTAPAGSYSSAITASAETHQPDLVDRVDLVLSWNVFEHFRSMDRALENVYSYLKPGGTLVSLFSGRWSAFGVINRILPEAVTHPIVDRLRHRTATNKPIFPAYYDGCYAAALRRLTAQWRAAEITPLYRGAEYFDFSRTLMRIYLVYENCCAQRGWANAATHYLLVATR